MPAVVIPCPHCQAELKLNDRKLLGKKGKCPKCAQTFVLEEPDEVELELVAPTSLSGVNSQAAITPAERSAPQQVSFDSQITSPIGDTGGVERMKELRRKNKKRRNSQIIFGGIMAVVLAGAFFYLKAERDRLKKQSAEAVTSRTDDDFQQKLRQNLTDLETLEAAAPTHGEPISLTFMPEGTRVVVNLHPDEFWAPGTLAEEFRFCLGPIGVWLEAQIKDLSGFEPAQIDRMRICLIPGEKGDPPYVAAYVELKEEQSESSMIKLFRGDRANPGYEPPVYVSAERCYIRISNRQFAVGPAQFAQKMSEAISSNALTDQDFEMMLLKTDRDRHLSILFDPNTLRQHQNAWFPENSLPFLNRFLDWIGDDVRCAVWSVHLEDQFYQEMILRNDRVVLPDSLQRKLTKRLDKVPDEVLAAVRKMNPQQIGPRKIISRFPAMTKVLTLATRSGSGSREVQFTTVLNDRAAPNLALGTLLTWDESTRTDFNSTVEPPTAVAVADEKPKTLAEKLQQKIEIDFRRTLMNDAFKYISEDSGIPIKLDGEALKLAGFTQNMPQVLKIEGETTVAKAIKAIFRGDGNAIIKDQLAKGTGEMVVYEDKVNNGLIVTTKKFVTDNKIEPYELK